MTKVFNKYHRAANDFVITDNLKGLFNPAEQALVNKLCEHRFTPR